ncbi:MAG: multicopper oxidase domain-containing protein [Actinomycetota bacterium]|nr:multicopper oxidase domain-containing protein [Actinomycetota bacterium]
MSILSRVPAGTSGSPSLRRLAAVTGTALLAATFVQTETAHGLAAPSTTPAVAAPATLGAASSLAAASATSVGKLGPSGCTVTGTSDTCDLFAAAGKQLVAGQNLDVWGFATAAPDPTATPAVAVTAPGPNLVVTQGHTVTVTLHNQVAGQSMTLAFPGIGAARFTAGFGQGGVTAGGTASYTFEATEAGTFVYEAGHTVNGARQVAMGLAGALVVLPADSSGYDDESVLVLSEIDPALALDPTGFDMRKYTPQYRLINGNTFPEVPEIATNPESVVKLRYVNVGQRQHPMTLMGAAQTTTARDGHALPYPTGEETAVLEPGMTEDTLVTIPKAADDPTTHFTLYESGNHLNTAGQLLSADSTQGAFGGLITALDTTVSPATGDTVGPKASGLVLNPNPADGQSDVTVTATINDIKSGGSTIKAAEYVIDDPTGVTPGGGSTMVVSDTTATSTTVTGTITPGQMAALGGKHTIYVAGQDSQNNWGAYSAAILTVQGYGALTTSATASPNPYNLQGPLTVDATGDASATGAKVKAAQYYVGDTMPSDADWAANSQPMATNRLATIVAETVDIPATAFAGVTDGQHAVWVRSQDNRGPGLWGPPLEIDFTVDTVGPKTLAADLNPNITNGLISAPASPGYASLSASVVDEASDVADAEAFISPVTEPSGSSFGTGLQLLPDQPTIHGQQSGFHGRVPLSQLRTKPNGTYLLYVHGKDAAGNWGPFSITAFEVDKTAPVLGALTAPADTAGAPTITVTADYTDNSTHNYGAAEFWWGTSDPGAGHGTAVTATPGASSISIGSLPVTGVAPGLRQLNLRVMDQAGNWSNVSSKAITVTPSTLVLEPFSGPLTSAWTTSGTKPGALTVVGGTLQVTSGSATAYLKDSAYVSRSIGSPQTTTAVTVDVDGTGVTRAGWTTILSATNGTGGQAYALQLQRGTAGQVQVRTVMTRIGQSPANGTVVSLPTGRAAVTLGWRAGPRRATAVSPSGQLTLSLNGSATPASTTRANTSTYSVSGISVGVVGTPSNPGLRQTLRLDNLAVTP